MVIAIINYKGGVGKTTSAINIGAGLARAGKRVLLVDTDPQSNLTTSLGIRAPQKTMYDFLLYEADFEQCVQTVLLNHADEICVHVLPSSESAARLQRELNDEPNREKILALRIEEYKPLYDYVLIDCSPTRNILNDNALAAADEAYIPVQTEHLAAQGLGLMEERVREFRRKRVNTGLYITGIIPTLYKSQQRGCQGVLEALRTAWGDVVFNTVIRDNAALRDCPARAVDIFSYAPRSAGAEDYGALVQEILARHSVSALTPATAQEAA